MNQSVATRTTSNVATTHKAPKPKIQSTNVIDLPSKIYKIILYKLQIVYHV